MEAAVHLTEIRHDRISLIDFGSGDVITWQFAVTGVYSAKEPPKPHSRQKIIRHIHFSSFSYCDFVKTVDDITILPKQGLNFTHQ